jgi:hypothetical protein
LKERARTFITNNFPTRLLKIMKGMEKKES